MPALLRRRRPVRTTAVTASVVLTVLLSSCSFDTGQQTEPAPSLSPAPVPEPTSAGAPADADLQRYYDQDVTWQPCRTDLECATIRVPLDYARPDGETIELSLLRVPATDQQARIGSLVVNPGGPGGSGVDYAASATTYFGPELRRVFDIVGFDPRGVGESTPVDCLTDEQLDETVAFDPDPDNAAEVQAARQLLVEFGQGCVDNSGELAAHVSTVEAARDIDIIRAVVGDRRLSYFGASYGTFLGATYAELFPGRVGRMVLDGAIDPTLPAIERSLVQARGFEVALRAYVKACVDRGGCFLGDSVDAGTKRIRQLLDSVERRPLPTAGTRQLEVGNAVLGIWAPLYNRTYWSFLDQALQAGIDGNGTPLLALSDAYTSRGNVGYLDNALEALYAVNCLDDTESFSLEEAEAQIPRFEKASPTFGAIFAYGLASCTDWPVPPNPGPEVLDADGAPPIVVIGTTRDPATPLVWAEALAEQLDSGVLIRRDGDGHTGYRAGNTCVDEAVEAYLVSGKAPRSTLDC